LWSDLFLENRENVLSELENFRTQIETLQKLINENNREGLQEFLQKAACHRKEIVL
jgi:prephenate dehydrogenase